MSAAPVPSTLIELSHSEHSALLGDMKQKFVGMSKEELMKYANDPFWVRLRWVLFVGFWLLWAAMLGGAVLIIVAAPKCVQPEPRSW